MLRASPAFCLLGLAFLPACGVAAAIDRDADHQLQDLRARSNRDFVYTSCEGGGVAARCGLILKWTAKESFREKFRERVCKERNDEECQTAFNRYVDAHLARRYFAADWEKVTQYCDMNPVKCDDPVNFELALVDSHNAVIRNAHVEEENRIQAERARRHAEHQAAVAATVVGVVNEVAHATHKGPKCRSYPSILTGDTLTTCSR